MPHVVRQGIFNADQKGEIGAATGADQAGADRAEADRVKAVTVDDGITAAVEGTIENTQKAAHTKMYKFW